MINCKFMFTNGIDLVCKLYGKLCNINEYSFKCEECKIEREVRMVSSEVIKIKYLADIDKIEKISCGDWVDLRTAKDIMLDPGEFAYIPLGVCMELPKNYEALVAPRSSTFKKYGLLQANSIGVIDETYKGDDDQWHFPAYATRLVFIPKNTRICQFRIIEHQPVLVFKEVDKLSENNRGGLGSTGD